ncbi:MAG: FAD/NAD(P)-binding oxidoreductase, partial [Sphaerochaetaceae bacterium]|nr:FAD/NAD(P)-binding oxidoreductase [Sphaerochaetaceae bacterium]
MNLRRLNQKLELISPDVHAFLEDGVLHIEGNCNSYQDVVRCGVLGTQLKSRGVVNDAKSFDVVEKPMRVPLLSDKSLEGKHFDVVIIGAGVVGCAIAMELS